jgi:hypothetical protein
VVDRGAEGGDGVALRRAGRDEIRIRRLQIRDRALFLVGQQMSRLPDPVIDAL